jgi:hypothetical protein
MAEDIQVKREIVLEADAEALRKMRKGTRAALRSTATRPSASAARIRRRRRWPISACRWPFDCSHRFPGTGK